MPKPKTLRVFRGNLSKKWRSHGDRLLAGTDVATCHVHSDETGREYVRFMLVGHIYDDIEPIIARLQGIIEKNTGKAGVK